MRRTHIRRIWLWLAFATLWSLVFAAVLWLGRSVIRLDQAERDARRSAAIEESLRLGLWRLDSILAPLLAQEALALIPEPDGIDAAAEREQRATTAGQSTDSVLQKIPVLSSFRWELSERRQESLNGDVIEPMDVLGQMKEYSRFRTPVQPTQLLLEVDQTAMLENFSSQQNRALAANEFNQRAQNLERGNQLFLSNSAVLNQSVVPQPFTAVWHQSKLLLVRRAILEDSQLEGWLVDWPALRDAMRSSVLDLLPEADFFPIEDVATQSSPDMLVSIPCLMIPGSVAGDFQDTVSDRGLSVWFVLTTVWIGVLATAVATALLLAGVLRLSDRREAFVAAVTHELRTPLTTLQLYAEMLNSGMIKDEATRQSYLSTLQTEVERIGHLVENVFAFARLERDRGHRTSETIVLRTVIDRIEPRLNTLADRFDMQLVIEPSEAWNSCVSAEPSIVEQILVNLVDNASKYARDASDRRIQLGAQAIDQKVHVSVQDHGPGIVKASQWWTPFSKSVEQAAESAPGIGLGLAISHRFAKQLGGKLVVENRLPSGARVTLTLPMIDPGTDPSGQNQNRPAGSFETIPQPALGSPY